MSNEAEMERATVLFHTAMIGLGAKTVEDSLALWGDVPPTPKLAGGRVASRWLATMVRYVMRRRLRSRDLALAYYRYQRALATGKTIALPGRDNPQFTTLPELKREFEALLGGGAGTEEEASPEPVSSSSSDDTPEESEAGDGQIEVEEIAGLTEDLDRLESEAEKQIENNLDNLGPKNQDRKINAINSEDAATVDAERTKANAEAGNRQAATAARGAMNGARGPLYLTASKDAAVIGWVRVSKTGTPCGFCAMLISREVVYRSESSAGFSEEGDLYHDNCQCVAIPVFSMTQYRSNDLFALNRKYAELWPIVTKGLSGDAAMRAWRRFIRQEAKSQKKTPVVEAA